MRRIGTEEVEIEKQADELEYKEAPWMNGLVQLERCSHTTLDDRQLNIPQTMATDATRVLDLRESFSKNHKTSKTHFVIRCTDYKRGSKEAHTGLRSLVRLPELPPSGTHQRCFFAQCNLHLNAPLTLARLQSIKYKEELLLSLVMLFI